jgi:hypothetical protein
VEKQKQFNFKLNDKQKEYYNALKWFLDDKKNNRQTGRSVLMYLIYLEIAISKPNEWIYPQYIKIKKNEHLFDKLARDILLTKNSFTEKTNPDFYTFNDFEFRKYSFRYIGKEE